MKLLLASCLTALLFASLPALAGPTNPMALTTEQAKVEFDDIARQLTTSLLLQPHQQAVLHRAIARELRAFTSAQARPDAPTPAADNSISGFERSLTEILSPSQLVAFEQLKTKTSLGEKLHSALFMHQ